MDLTCQNRIDECRWIAINETQSNVFEIFIMSNPVLREFKVL